MKRSIIMALMVSCMLYSCKDGAAKEAEKDATTEKEAPAEKAAASEKEELTPVYVVNEADWVETDLSKISPQVPITVKLPKTAVLEKADQEGVVYVKINDNYLFIIQNMGDLSSTVMVSQHKDEIRSDDGYQGVKLPRDEKDGFVYTRTMKADEYSKKYDYDYSPESHFYYVMQKGKVSYVVSDDQSQSDVTKIYTEDAAVKSYDIIKNSMKIK